jgi:hypothetical protein
MSMKKKKSPFLWAIEIHDMQEIVTAIERYLQRLGDIDLVLKQWCSIGIGISAVL